MMLWSAPDIPAISIGIMPGNIFRFAGSFAGDKPNADPRFRGILWYIVAGTRGGVNRAHILNLLKDTPANANKIATMLDLDHKTIVHHLKILLKNELIIKDAKDYDARYHLTNLMRDNQDTLAEIMEKIGRKGGNNG